MDLLHLLVYVLLSVGTLIYLALRKRFSYWSDRGIIHEKPVLFYGNLREVGRTQPLFRPFRDFYLKYRGQAPFGGFYLFMRRAVLLLDLELVKCVLIKDFANFAHRGNYYNEKDDPLSAHLFNLDGPKWRAMRSKLSPTFTSGKMRFMLPCVVEVAEQFVTVLGDILEQKNKAATQQTDDEAQTSRKTISSEEAKLLSSDEIANAATGIEIKELLARFTTDVIGNCAFGLECNSLKDPNTQFRLMGKRAFSTRRHPGWVFALIQAFPKLARKLGMKTVLPDVNDFFLRIVRETVEYRERENIQRNDFMNILLELKHQNELEGLTLEEIAAQAFVFFLAGFETSSSTMVFCLYELALNPEIQDRARAEIVQALERHNGEFNYECFRELKYLQQIMQETLRIYSIASLVIRKTINDYPVPNSKHVIERGTVVIIPIDGIHHDPDIYPDPERFDPERFTPEAVEQRSSVAWLPFGEGPRNCIGARFGEMQVIIGLAMLLKHFRFSPAPETQIPLEFDLKNFILASKGGMFLKIEKI